MVTKSIRDGISYKDDNFKYLVMKFINRFRDIGSSKDTRIISAIDVTTDLWPKDRLYRFIEEISPYVIGFKVGIPTILSYGLDVISKMIVKSDDVIWIADMKLADIGYVGRLISRIVSKTGFDAIIIHGFIGFREGLEDIIGECESLDLAPIIVAAMSHRGAEEYINRMSESIVKESLRYGVAGYILPATFTRYISKYRRLISDRLILSPGVGVQGASPGSAVEAGADAEIVGRLIYMDEEPISRVRELRGVLRWHRRG